MNRKPATASSCLRAHVTGKVHLLDLVRVEPAGDRGDVGVARGRHGRNLIVGEVVRVRRRRRVRDCKCNGCKLVEILLLDCNGELDGARGTFASDAPAGGEDVVFNPKAGGGSYSE